MLALPSGIGECDAGSQDQYHQLLGSLHAGVYSEGCLLTMVAWNRGTEPAGTYHGMYQH